MSLKLQDIPYEERIRKGINDEFMRNAVSAAQGRFRKGKAKQANELGNWEDWRQLASEIRAHTIENLDYYLQELSENVSRRGGHVYFAETAQEARAYIKTVIKKKQAKKIVKSKSMVTEEIQLNKELIETGVEVIETDLGEWILQLEGDKPSHIVTPALHKNKEHIRETFAKKRGYTGSSDP